MIPGSTLTVVWTNTRHLNGLKMILALQLKRGLAHDEPMFKGILVESSKTTTETVPEDILCVLEKYRDIMPNSLPKSLPPRRMIDLEMELLMGAKPPAKNAYCMTPP